MRLLKPIKKFFAYHLDLLLSKRKNVFSNIDYFDFKEGVHCVLSLDSCCSRLVRLYALYYLMYNNLINNNNLIKIINFFYLNWSRS